MIRVPIALFGILICLAFTPLVGATEKSLTCKNDLEETLVLREVDYALSQVSSPAKPDLERFSELQRVAKDVQRQVRERGVGSVLIMDSGSNSSSGYILASRSILFELVRNLAKRRAQVMIQKSAYRSEAIPQEESVANIDQLARLFIQSARSPAAIRAGVVSSVIWAGVGAGIAYAILNPMPGIVLGAGGVYGSYLGVRVLQASFRKKLLNEYRRTIERAIDGKPIRALAPIESELDLP